jgi:hypothetical protein
MSSGQTEVFTGLQVNAAIGLGVISLMMSGLMPLFLGALAGEHRLSTAGIGQIATVELLSSAIFTGLAGGVLKPRRLRLIGVLASLVLAAANLATLRTAGGGLMAARALAGAPEGVLLWLVVGLIARSPTPERRAAFLFTAMAASQLAAAVVLAVGVLPRFGADGGYVLMAALGAGMYIVPLALQAGLSSVVAQTAISVALAFEVVGGAFATALSGRVNFLDVLLGSAVAMLASFVVYLLKAPVWLFVVASASVGFCALLIMPFIVPMTIRADPSRRTAVQIGGAQLLGGAVGPVLASLAVDARDAHGAVYLSAALLVASLGAIYGLNRRTP